MDTKKVCLVIDEELIKKVKILAINKGQTLSNLVTDALTKLLEESEK